MSVTIGRDAVTLETTDYPGWTEFSRVLIGLLRALEDDGRPDGILRVGLRYIDEVRLPQPPDDVASWNEWIDNRLVAPFALDEAGALSTGTVILQYGESPGYVTVFRGSPFAAGRTVQQEGPLRMPFSTPDGPYFLLDTDASWADPGGGVPEFETDQVVSILEELHTTCRRLFEASVTDRFRTEVLSRSREEVWQS